MVNQLDQDELADLIYRYGEEPASRKIARATAAARPIHTADQLAGVIEKAIGRRGRIHPATLTFQALRIAVNDELGSLMTRASAGNRTAAQRRPPGGDFVSFAGRSHRQRVFSISVARASAAAG